MSSNSLRIVGINFDHFHMGDLLRMVHEHPEAEIAAICDHQPERMREAVANFALSEEQVFTDHEACLESIRPDLVILCPAAARHAEWVEKVARFHVPVMVEKPFAASLEEADRMIAAMRAAGQPLAINWPLRWEASHATAHRLVGEGRIGDVVEVYWRGGNRGPLYHGADKIEKEPTPEAKAASWFYKRSEGGGSLLDYLGYGTTLGTWLNGGRIPDEVACLTAGAHGLEVDEHSVTVARYGDALSTFETRWGTFSDPWTCQPQPKTGFVLVGTEGTLASFDYEETVRLQTRDKPEGESLPVDHLEAPYSNPVEYMVHCLRTGSPIEGPLSVEVSRIGQQIVDTAFESARQRRALPLVGGGIEC